MSERLKDLEEQLETLRNEHVFLLRQFGAIKGIPEKYVLLQRAYERLKEACEKAKEPQFDERDILCSDAEALDQIDTLLSAALAEAEAMLSGKSEEKP